MSYTQSDLDRLKKAFASGVTEVTYHGKTTRFRSLNDLRRAIAEVEGYLSSSSKSCTGNIITGTGL